jgi:hypothetical protein
MEAVLTLVVGRIFNGKTYIFADTALTSPLHKRLNPYTDGCLKCYIVRDDLALAFSGVEAAFKDACATLLSMHSSNEIIEYAKKAQAEGWEVEILVAEAGRGELTTVKDGLENKSLTGFLGDAQAFNSFQQYLNAPDSIFGTHPDDTVQMGIFRLPEPLLQDEIYGRMFDSFKAVIEDVAHPTVGGAVIPLCTHNGVFQYLNYATVFSPFNKTMLDGQPIPFGTAVNGGYAVELCTDKDAKEPGFYFLQGGFGLLFPRQDSGFRGASVLQAEGPAYFVLEAGKVLQYQILSCYTTPDTFGIAGASLYALGRYDDALKCYEIGNGYEALRKRPLVRDRYIGQFAAALYACGDKDKAISILRRCIAEQPLESNICKCTLYQISP